ncbi:MAG: flagellar hook-basal body complex protein FliE [Lentisphaeraceae bacterium]|nr:flagellar hook-basal body complex protein FliE [Lentisphaeraceae bacterium]
MINEIQPQLEALRTQFDEIQQLRKDNGASDSDAPSFDKVLGDLISEVDVAQKEADVSIKQLAAGESTSIQDVVMKMEEADIAFQLMKEVRNKLLEAYKEVLSMSS